MRRPHELQQGFSFAVQVDDDAGDVVVEGGLTVTRTASPVNGWKMTGVADGQSVTLELAGADTHIGGVIKPKGLGGLNLADGGGVPRVLVNPTGIGFNNTAPVAKPTITGSRGGNAALASLLTGLASMGLITDNTTA